MDDLIGHSITCRVAVGSRAQYVGFSLQEWPAPAEPIVSDTAPGQHTAYRWSGCADCA